MGIWRAFLDDSGSDGAPLFPDFTKRPIDPMDGTPPQGGLISPITTTGLIAVNTNYCHLINGDLKRFRADIRRRFLDPTDPLPKIHMRQLWNPRHDGGRNPFFNLSESHRNQIISESYNFLGLIIESYSCLVSQNHANVAASQDRTYQFFNTERQLKEREIIYSRFSKNKVAERFFKLIMHPTMGLVSAATVHLDSFCRSRGHNAIINYDNSDASKGFNTAQLFNVLHEANWAKRVRYDKHDNDTDECLLQLADLASFHAFRSMLTEHRGKLSAKDRTLLRLASGFSAKMGKQRRAVSEFDAVPFQSVAIHYLVGRQHLEAVDKDWVNRHLKTHLELQAEFENNQAMGNQGGIPIVRETSYTQYLANGTIL